MTLEINAEEIIALLIGLVYWAVEHGLESNKEPQFTIATIITLLASIIFFIIVAIKLGN